MGAVMQWEFDRKRLSAYQALSARDTPWTSFDNILVGSVRDTVRHGGTFVLVATNEKITLVQRPIGEGEEL